MADTNVICNLDENQNENSYDIRVPYSPYHHNKFSAKKQNFLQKTWNINWYNVSFIILFLVQN